MPNRSELGADLGSAGSADGVEDRASTPCFRSAAGDLYSNWSSTHARTQASSSSEIYLRCASWALCCFLGLALTPTPLSMCGCILAYCTYWRPSHRGADLGLSMDISAETPQYAVEVKSYERDQLLRQDGAFFVSLTANCCSMVKGLVLLSGNKTYDEIAFTSRARETSAIAFVWVGQAGKSQASSLSSRYVLPDRCNRANDSARNYSHCAQEPSRTLRDAIHR